MFAKEYAEDVKVIEVEIEGDELYLVGDKHFDSLTFKSKLWRQAVDIIKDTPVIDLGDNIDFGFYENLQSMVEKILSRVERVKEWWIHNKSGDLPDGTDMQDIVESIESLLISEYLENVNVIVACMGNHDERIARRTGTNVVKKEFVERGIPVVDGQALIKVHVGKKRNGKDRVYRIVITHGWRGGRSETMPMKELVDISNTWAGVDVIAIGHHHQFTYRPITKHIAYFDKVYTEITHLVSVPAFLGWETYLQRKGARPPLCGMVRLKFEPKEGGIIVEPIFLS